MIRTTILLPLLFLLACSDDGAAPVEESEPFRLSNAEAWAMIRDNCGQEEFCLIDVRAPEEVAGGYGWTVD